MFPLENWAVCAIGSDEPGARQNWPPHLGAVTKKFTKNIHISINNNARDNIKLFDVIL